MGNKKVVTKLLFKKKTQAMYFQPFQHYQQRPTYYQYPTYYQPNLMFDTDFIDVPMYRRRPRRYRPEPVKIEINKVDEPAVNIENLSEHLSGVDIRKVNKNNVRTQHNSSESETEKAD